MPHCHGFKRPQWHRGPVRSTSKRIGKPEQAARRTQRSDSQGGDSERSSDHACRRAVLACTSADGTGGAALSDPVRISGDLIL